MISDWGSRNYIVIPIVIWKSERNLFEIQIENLKNGVSDLRRPPENQVNFVLRFCLGHFPVRRNVILSTPFLFIRTHKVRGKSRVKLHEINVSEADTLFISTQMNVYSLTTSRTWRTTTTCMWSSKTTITWSSTPGLPTPPHEEVEVHNA